MRLKPVGIREPTMKLLMFSCFSFLTTATTQETNRLSISGTAQEVADVFLGAVWTRMAGSEFVGGVADVYLNKQIEFPNPEVTLSKGKIKGIVSVTSRDRKPYSAFMGIPFAKPPVGNLRFKAPEEFGSWEGTYDATYERSTCLTFREPTKGHEDCLYLNVFTPTNHPEKSSPGKPVMVFIYGGAFMGGSSNTSGYAPDFLLDKDALVITFNYRIGPLGFLSLQNKDVPGNAGLKDQVMALRWVKENIEYFGGDPEKVTIFGESAGAASVSYLVISPLAAGLFNRAIMESGSALATWAYTDPKSALEKAFLLGQRIGCTVPATMSQRHELYECLKDTPGALLTRSQPTGLSIEEILSMRPLAFVPTTEPDYPGALIAKSPIEHLASGEYNKIPIIMGINTAEGLLFYPVARQLNLLGPGVAMTVLGQDLTKLLPRDLNATISQQQRTEINQRLHHYYTGQKGPFHTVKILEFLQVISDTQFLIPMLRTADFLANSDEPVFLYLFSYDGRYSCYKTDDEMRSLNGTSHMDELGYLFNIGPIKKEYNHADRSRPEEKVIDLITTLWTTFANFGQPAEGEWEQFSTSDPNYCDIGVTAVGMRSIQKRTVAFWNGIYQLVTGSRKLPE